MIAGMSDKNLYPGLRHHRITMPQAIIVHQIDRRLRSHLMIRFVGVEKFPAHRELMLMPMENMTHLLTPMDSMTHAPAKTRAIAPVGEPVAWTGY